MIENLTVTVCTLNEEKNIRDCLQSIILEKPQEIIVVDAGSTDKTKKIVGEFDVTYVDAGRKGLAYQRSIAIEQTNTKYVCILDADHRVKKGSLSKMIKELEYRKLDGIEAQIIQYEKQNNYWNYCFDVNFEVSHNIPRDTIMIGTPCIYITEILKKNNFDPFFTGPSDDTDLCYRLIKNGHRIGVGESEIFHKHRTSFKEFTKKMIWYGKGDAQFIFKHPERTPSMLYHQIINYPLIKSFKSIKKGKIITIPFFIMYGYLRFMSMIYHVIYFNLISSKDNKIFRS